MKNKTNKKELKEKIMKIIKLENRFISGREVTNILQKKFNIKKTQLTIRDILKELQKEGRLQKE